ncbi:quinone-dependent dihydroorotate dehydrogenase [Paenactinomyces guangxiensis]|uniref:Dihydroorotate dehydrogenase (quinone) n=1 Tax=Paenactinomyces guangxiensis TaxID=1490290 RepID=A0A7W1WUR9_9BACL|nr:quinone-dependent dihydroorotate dehydrogenase [Paenactinomyces guangxiensis]MBA4496226.1 quinone-dependent dihydroorotate dehydrogenase [Paenactinomyces guangxiensis]MBH8593317.1 quinone-dependent dihydroorotate dehydrogenase [Paenactinomyces guangxiensis]
MYSSLRKILFQINPETAHEWTIRSLNIMQSNSVLKNWFQKKMTVTDSRLSTECLGLHFPNPVGLAAGFDKHAGVYPAFAALGFGFVEVGTLTPRPQPGNPSPRLFRLPPDQALINRMGFNNHGVEQAKQTFEHLPRPPIPIGINLGKNKDTPNEQASRDYLTGLKTLYGYGDYFVINISSPNTKGLRDLQQVDALGRLLTDILARRNELADQTGKHRPVLLKIAPDLSPESLSDIIKTALHLEIDGVIATNTTLSREGLQSARQNEAGGLSGRPLTRRSTELIRQIYAITGGKIPIIGVGGIFTGKDAYDKIRAGANLIQVYTGMIYRGPSIARLINEELLQLLEQDQLSSIREAVGLDHHKN